MATRTGYFGTVVSAFVTGIVMPVTVHFLVTTNKIEVAFHNEAPSIPIAGEERLIADGVGLSPDEAWNDAVSNALRNATASLVDGQTWSQSSTLICNQLQKDRGSLIVRSKDIWCSTERGVWHRQVDLVISRSALSRRLKAAHWRVVTNAL